MIAYFRANCKRLHEVDSITIQDEIMDYFGRAKGIPQCIDTMEAAQACSKRSKLPISNKALVAIANRVMLATNKYAGKMKAWNKRRPNKRMWDNW